MDYLNGYPERLAVARVLVENGLSLVEGKIQCNEIIIPTVSIGRAAGVDRRTVSNTIKMIEENPELQVIFKNIEPAGTSLKKIARFLNLGVAEITPTNARMPGILAEVAKLLAERNISIRQAIVDDPELSPEPKLVLIAEKKIPGELIPDLLKTIGVSKVSIY